MKNLFWITLFACSALFSLNSCVDQSFDEPPVVGEDLSGIDGNITVASLKALYAGSGEEFLPITDDLILRVVVTADDRSGNFFRSMIVQDETGGISVSINATDFYNAYPIGRELAIRLRGTVMGEFAGSPVIGGYTYLEEGFTQLANIVALDDHIIRGKLIGAPDPVVKAIGELTPADAYRLITIEDVEFVDSDLNQTYADPIGRSSVNRVITSCPGATMLVRTSGFSDFAADVVPSGNGSITGIYSIFNTDQQLLIRNTDDVDFPNVRCDGTTGGGGGGGTGGSVINPVDSLSEDFSTVGENQNVNLSGWSNFAAQGSRVWRGDVFQTETYVVATAFQDNAQNADTWMITPPVNVKDGMTLSFETSFAFWTNNHPNYLTVLLSTDYDGSNFNAADWQPVNAQIAAESDGQFTWVPSGDIDLSSYAGQSVAVAFRYQGSGPNGLTTNARVDNVYMGYGSAGSGNGGGGGGGGGNTIDPVDSINEDFSSVGEDEDVDLTGWTNSAVQGSRVWRGDVFQMETYVTASAFRDNSPEADAWLITPPVNITSGMSLNFISSYAFWTSNHDDYLSVLISTDYDGSNFSSADWQPINARLAEESDGQFTWVPSGNIDLSSYAGETVAIAFRYQGSGPNNQTTNGRIDDVVIE